MGAVLLQSSLVVGVVPLQFAGCDSLIEECMHETSRSNRPTGDVNGTDHGLHGVSEDGGLISSCGVDLTLPQPDQLPQMQLARHLSQGMGADY